jgi:hypothetical protein
MAEVINLESKVVLVWDGEGKKWCPFDNNWWKKIFSNRQTNNLISNRQTITADLTSHSYYGVKEMFRKNGWISGILKWLGNHRCDYEENYSAGKNFWQFWVPVLSETMMRRYWRRSSEQWDEWEVFPQSQDKLSIFSVEGFKEFIEKNPGYGWDMQYMTQDIDDPHLWHHEGKEKNELWFPVIKSEVKKARSGRLVCVNTIGAALTEGREYELRDETDGLLQVVDDEGVLREFLPCRFK